MQTQCQQWRGVVVVKLSLATIGARNAAKSREKKTFKAELAGVAAGSLLPNVKQEHAHQPFSES
jgi:hypothetical protein